MLRPKCDRCNDEKVVRGSHPLLVEPCPSCCIVTDPPEPELDLSADAVSEPPPAFPEDEIPTGKILQPLAERPTPLVEQEIPPEAIPEYRRALERLTPVPIPPELLKRKA